MNRLLSIMTFSIVLILSCRTNPDLLKRGENRTIEGQSLSSPASSRPPTLEELKASDQFSTLNDYQKEMLIAEMMDSMTLDEKIGQLFILAVRHTANGQAALTVDDTVNTFIREYKPGGVILFSINFSTPGQTKKLIQDLQETSSFPLFVATDEEGGKVSRLGKATRMDVISLPPASRFGEMGTADLTEKSAEVLGLDMRELGFNMNMAPVADVVVPGESNPIGDRSYSSNAERAGIMTAAAVKGFLKAGISPVLKHFPGHGNVGGDSHNGAVSSRSSREDFFTRDFIPFQKGVEAGCHFVMVGHISAPSLSETKEPASLSYDIQTDILRKQLGYEGLIITDAMDMGAITNIYPPDIASLKAFMAGTDIILMPENIPAAQRSIKEAIGNGSLSLERLNESIKRILKIKMDKGMFDHKRDSIQDFSTKERAERHALLINQLNSQ